VFVITSENQVLSAISGRSFIHLAKASGLLMTEAFLSVALLQECMVVSLNHTLASCRH